MTADPFQATRERHIAAAGFTACATFVPGPRKPDRRGRADLLSYRVLIGNTEVGVVEHTYETVGRKVGRVLFGQKRVRRWAHSPGLEAERDPTTFYPSRRAATEAMIERILAAGWRYEDGCFILRRKKRRC